MVVTNQTSFDIYFGPLHLGAGVGTTLTVDDTSATSLYLLDDAVADALNNAYLAQKIQVSGQALPFPRPTGEPQMLHGSGSPEGSVYAPPASMFLRRDTSGAGNALYAKTTGRTFSTGWQSFGVPIASPLSGGPPATPLDGDIWIATAVDPNDTRWAFQYNAGSSSPYKWDFIGGAPVLAANDAQVSLNGSANWQTIFAGPTLARAGDYEIDYGTFAGNNAAQANLVTVGVATAGASAPITNFDAIVMRMATTTAAGDTLPGWASGIAAALAANTTLYLVANVPNTSVAFLRNKIKIRPRRIS